MTGRRPRIWLATPITAAVGALCLLTAGGASAATQLGETFVPPDDCAGLTTFLQTTSPGGQYLAPVSGVITSWSFEANATPPQVKFKVGRAVGVNSFTIVGESGLKAPVPNGLNTYTDVAIPVQAGDVIGSYYQGLGDCFRQSPSHDEHYFHGDPPVGATVAFTPEPGFQLDVSATLEPDCDKDGLGDETQDADLSPCVPDTTITAGPKDKTKKRKASFEFTAASPLAASQPPTFQCRLDAGPFEPCTSPKTYEVKRGKHSFQVQATVEGFTDPTAATDSWKRKKKKR